MEAVLDISDVPNQLNDLVDDFARLMLKRLVSDLDARIPKERLVVYNNELKNQKFMMWIYSPIELDFKSFLKLLYRSITFEIANGKLIFKVNNHLNFPGSHTNMSTIFKFLAYGNGYLSGIHQIIVVFEDYNKNLNSYWQDYLKAFLKTLKGGQ